MIFTLTACGASTPDTPSAVVDKNFKSLKSQEDKTYKEFREGFFQSINLDPKKSDDASKLADKFIEQLMKFEYKIGKETVKGKEAKVEIEVKTYDFKKIIAFFSHRHDSQCYCYSCVYSHSKIVLQKEDIAWLKIGRAHV